MILAVCFVMLWKDFDIYVQSTDTFGRFPLIIIFFSMSVRNIVRIVFF